MTDLNNIVTFVFNLPSQEDQYSYLALLKTEMSEGQFGDLKKALSGKGFNVSEKKLGEVSPMTEEKLMGLVPSVISSVATEELGKSELSEEEKTAILAAFNQAQPQVQSNGSSRGFGGEDLILSAKWLGAASAALTAGGLTLMRDDLSVGGLAGSALGVVGGYFAADYVDSKLSGSGSFTRYLAALSTGTACGAAGNFLGSLAQEKLFSNKESDVDINITIETPGESQALNQLTAVDYC